MAKSKKPVKKITSTKSVKKVTPKKPKVKPEGKQSSDPTKNDLHEVNPTQKPTISSTSTIDVPRMEGDGVITIPEPVDRSVHWTDGMKAENVEKDQEAKEGKQSLPPTGSTSMVQDTTTVPVSQTETIHSGTTASRPVSSVVTPRSGLGAYAAQMEQAERNRMNGTPQHIVVVARAGTGKTTTLVEGLKLLKGLGTQLTPSEEQASVWDEIGRSKHHKFTCFAAFNAAIAKELKERVPPGVDAKTMHSIGFGAVRRAFQLPDDAVKRGEERIANIIQEILQEDIRVIRKANPTLVSITQQLVELCKSNLIDMDHNDEEQRLNELAGLIYQYDLEVEGDVIIRGERQEMRHLLTHLVPRILERCKDVNKDKCITFTDMIWLPVVLNLPLFKFDILFCDEAQDLSPCQHELVKRLGRRIILVGDPMQSIYGFAGADSESIPRITHYLRDQPQGCKELKLTVTRRCAKAIVREANKEVPDFHAHPDNPEGSVKTMKYPLQPKKGPGGEKSVVELPVDQTYLPYVEPGDMVLCRSVAPLVGQYFKFMKLGKPASIQGKDIAQQIINLITKMKVVTTIELVGKLDDWLHEETAKEQEKRNPRESYIQSLRDRYECAKFFAEECKLITDVIRKIEEVFVKDGTDTKKIRLMSIHKSKGLESNRVFYLRPAVYPGRREDKMLPWQVNEESCLRYVAKTRAINELVFVV